MRDYKIAINRKVQDIYRINEDYREAEYDHKRLLERLEKDKLLGEKTVEEL